MTRRKFPFAGFTILNCLWFFTSIAIHTTPARAAQNGTSTPAPMASNNFSSNYVLGVDDEVEITVTNHADLNRSVIVRPDGKISFPRAGDIQAAGRTGAQLAAALQTELDKTLNHARVLVLLKTAKSQQARVTGAVTKPGAYDIKPGWRVMDLVSVAEGLTTKAVRIQGRVVRAGITIPFSVEEASLRPQSAANVALQPNDLVILDARDIRNALHVVGAVAHPGAYDLEEGLNPVSLVSQAGGVTPEAALRGAHVLRGGEQIPLDLEATLVDGKRDPAVLNFDFQPGDVLVIPENNARVGVMGEVVKPSYYALPEKPEDATVLKVLALAGGPAPDADLKGATVTRTQNGATQVFPIDIPALLNGTAPDTFRLQSDDVLNIPKSFNQVHVIGQVAKPGVYDLKNGLSLLSLLSEAGNTLDAARLSHSYVLRKGQQIPLDLRAALSDGTPNLQVASFQLQPGDVVVVPENQQRFGVMGQVLKPGFYAFPESGHINVLEALGIAGGQIPQGEDRGNLSGAGVIRNINGKPTVIPVNLEAMLSKGKAGQNIELQPDDIVYVPPKKKGFKWTDALSALSPLTFLLRKP